MARQRHTRLRPGILDEGRDVLGSKIRIYLTFAIIFLAVNSSLLSYMLLMNQEFLKKYALIITMLIPFSIFLLSQVLLFFIVRFNCRLCGTKNVQVLTFIVGHKAKCLNCKL